MTEINVNNNQIETANVDVNNNEDENTIIIHYRNQFDVLEYTTLVNQLVDGFFDENGEYTPHIGDMNAMLLFYNVCVVDKDVVTESGLPIDDFDNLDEVNALFSDDDFIGCYNEAIAYTGTILYDFGNALKTALEIVNYRVNSVSRALLAIYNQFSETLNKINTLMSPENIQLLSEFAKNVSNSNFNAQAVEDAFMATEAWKRIMETDKKNNEENDDTEESDMGEE